jgi:hypothetical protein
MTRKITLIAALALLAFPATATATHPNTERNAAKACKAQRTALGETTFRLLYGGGRNAYGKCVSQHARAQHDAQTNASQTCRQERETLGTAAFNAKYGKNRNDRNAFGKCVSQHAQQELATEQQETISAARSCRAERQSMGAAAFNSKYGKNRNDRNAFGKCVSQKVRD